MPGEGGSIFLKEEKAGPVELATISFGQRFEITPIQLVTAVFNLTYNDFMSNETMPSALQMLIYKSMSTYLIQCYNDKKPVLEEDGRLMWFSGCPWLSKVGVPWVPEEGYYD